MNPCQKAMKNCENNIEELRQDKGRNIENVLENMSKNLSLSLDIMCGKGSHRCWMKSCPCENHFDFASLLNSGKNHEWHFNDSGDYNSSIYSNMFIKALSSLDFPLNLRLSEFLFEDLMYRRKTRSINQPNGIFSALDGTEDIVLSRFGLDAFHKNEKAVPLFKRSHFVHLGILPGSKSLEYSKSSLLASKTLLPKSKRGLILVGKESSQVKSPEMKPVSCPCSDSASSYRSTLSVLTSITKGKLHCLQKCGMLYFIFSVDDAPQVRYMACPQKIECSVENAIDTLYFFYCKCSRNKNFKKQSMNPISLVAKLKASTSIVLKPNMMKTMETEFVLYGVKLSKEQHKFLTIKDYPLKVGGLFKHINVGKIKLKDGLSGQVLDDSGNANESNLVGSVFDGLQPNLELAAIVIKECVLEAGGGWGLKFLEKDCHKKSLPSKDEGVKSMNVMITTDFHGGPAVPASIVSRWRSNGHCDCGGWDLGCPLKVLSHSSTCSNTSLKDTEKKSVNLFIEGTKYSMHPSFSMMKLKDGLYSISFQSSLSVLQSFSIAVATIHSNYYS